MIPATLTPQNGHRPTSDQSWLEVTVRDFFTQVNWADQPPEIQAIQITTLEGTAPEMSLQLTVSQFFQSIPWDGKTVAAPAVAEELMGDASPPPSGDAFSVDDFADFF